MFFSLLRCSGVSAVTLLFLYYLTALGCPAILCGAGCFVAGCAESPGSEGLGVVLFLTGDSGHALLCDQLLHLAPESLLCACLWVPVMPGDGDPQGAISTGHVQVEVAPFLCGEKWLSVSMLSFGPHFSICLCPSISVCLFVRLLFLFEPCALLFLLTD